MSTETLRAAFEAWAAKETPPYRLERVLVPVSDLYAWNSTACAWEAFQAGAIAAAKQAEPVAQWVSVQERLPGPYELVLVYFDGADSPVTSEYVRGDAWRVIFSNEFHDEAPTHWMPLPPAPPSAEAAKGGE